MITTKKQRPTSRKSGAYFLALGRALDHLLRQRILELLEGQEEGLTVTDIYIRLRLEQSVASQHLAILRRANLVRTKRQGKFILYFINKRTEKLIGDMLTVHKK